MKIAVASPPIPKSLKDGLFWLERFSTLKNSRVVFNIKGNSYRLIVKFNYKKQWAFIRFIGTHVEYDQINANSI